MDYTQLETMVSQIVKRIVENHRIYEKNILVVHPNTSSAIKKIERLKILFHVDEWQGEVVDELINYYDFILFLEVDQQFIVNSAQGIIYSPETKLLSQLILREITPVLVPNDEFLTLVIQSSSNNPYIKMLQGYVKNLQQYGCTICEFTNVKNFIHPKQVISEKNKLITESTIKEYQNSVLSISNNTIITPLAIDAAKQKGITIKYE